MTSTLRQLAVEIWARSGETRPLPLIRINPVRCGRAYHKTHSITLPLWLLERMEPHYQEWYVAHELAHIIAGKEAAHGMTFQRVLARLAPDAWCWEATYKPRLYKLAWEELVGARL